MTGVQAVELDLLTHDVETAAPDAAFDRHLAVVVAYLDRERLTAADFARPADRLRWWPAYLAARLAGSPGRSPEVARILALARRRA